MKSNRAFRRISTVPVLAVLTLAAFACDGGRDAPPADVPRIEPHIVRTLPHDTLAFTQGLLLHDGLLYESTGAPRGRASRLRVLDPKDGAVLRSETVPRVFAEGLAVMDGTLLQLTWRNGVGIRYKLPGLRQVGLPRYDGEGWGLTTDDKHYYMGDGSDTLYVRDKLFKVVKRIPVTYKGNRLTQLNELEYARGRIYANVWFSDYIFEIDPSSGHVMRLIDCTSLVEQAGPLTQDQVLNGIAYDPTSDTFYITGKDWPVLYEVKIED